MPLIARTAVNRERLGSCLLNHTGYIENDNALKILTIVGVEATAETAEDGSYPLARPLFIYSAAEVMAEKPQVASFISYYLQSVNDVITEVGYFPASEEALNQAIEAWIAAQ